MLTWCLSQHISVKKAFLSKTERFGSFLFGIFYINLALPSAKSLQNGRFWFLLSRRKIEPVTTHKMASHLMDMNISFRKTCVWPILIIINTLKWRCFEYALTQERIGTVFSGVRPIAVTRDLCVRILKFTDKYRTQFSSAISSIFAVSAHCGEFYM